MAASKILYSNKDKNAALGTPERTYRDIDANEVKTVVNAHAEDIDDCVRDNDARLTDERTPTDGSVTNAKVAANAAIEPNKIAGTAVVDNDARLTNAREWTASTISQAEAETGTATTRRAFTAQRVRQAIVGWFDSIRVAISKLEDIPTNRFLGRNSSGTGAVEVLQTSTVKTMLNLPNDTASDLTAVATTANGALQRSGGDMTGAITGDQSARLYRPEGGRISSNVNISTLDKNSFFEINDSTPFTITLDGTSEPNVVREFMITNAGGGNNGLTILNDTEQNIVVSGLGVLATSASFTVGSVGDAFTIRSLSNGRYVVVGGEFTLVE